MDESSPGKEHLELVGAAEGELRGPGEANVSSAGVGVVHGLWETVHDFRKSEADFG